MEVNKKISVSFEKIKDYSISDIRFTKVKIWLMHLGKNLNGSIFNKESVVNALPSLANTPILGYIKENEDGTIDFLDHHIGIEVSNDEMKIKYKGHAFGVIPETNFAKFETKICDDGIEREFLTCQGLLWNKFSDAIDILNRDIVKNESMELADNYTGSFDEEGYFVFDKFFFDGGCFLGDNIQPAMKNANIEMLFSVNEIQSKLEQFNNYMINQTKNNENELMKGGQILEKKLIDNILAEYSVSMEDISFQITSNTTEGDLREYLKSYTKEEKLSEETITAIFKEFEVTKEEFEDFPDNISEEDLRTLVSEFVCKKKKNMAKKETIFSTYNEKREMLYNALPREEDRDEEGCLIKCVSYWISDLDENFVYVERETYNGNEWSYEKGRLSYSISDAVVTISTTFEPMVVKWITVEENVKIEKDRENFEAQNIELARLKEFESKTLKNEYDKKVSDIFKQFEEKLLDMPEYLTLKNNYSNLDLDTIEEKCYALLGKKNISFSLKNKTTKPDVVNLGFAGDDRTSEGDDDGYGGILNRKYKEN